jgi:hypothetical protein
MLYLHPAPSPSMRGFWFGRFDSPRIPAPKSTPVACPQLAGFMKQWRSTPFGSEATQAN